MRTLKFIAGLGCFVIALNLCLFVLGGFGWPFAICALGFVGLGCLLIANRNLPILRKTKVLIVLTFIFLVGLTVVFVIPEFIRAQYTTSANACINSLRVIDATKHEWALEKGKADDAIPTKQDLLPYFKDEVFPVCPAGGTYIIGRVGEEPKCSIGTSAWPNSHVLPDQEIKDNWWTDFKAAYSILFGLRHVQKPQLKPTAALQFFLVADRKVCRRRLRDIRKFSLRNCAAPRGRRCGSRHILD
jgi:hypothetical protein